MCVSDNLVFFIHHLQQCSQWEYTLLMFCIYPNTLVDEIYLEFISYIETNPHIVCTQIDVRLMPDRMNVLAICVLIESRF